MLNYRYDAAEYISASVFEKLVLKYVGTLVLYIAKRARQQRRNACVYMIFFFAHKTLWKFGRMLPFAVVMFLSAVQIDKSVN